MKPSQNDERVALPYYPSTTVLLASLIACSHKTSLTTFGIGTFLVTWSSWILNISRSWNIQISKHSLSVLLLKATIAMCEVSNYYWNLIVYLKKHIHIWWVQGHEFLDIPLYCGHQLEKVLILYGLGGDRAVHWLPQLRCHTYCL